MKATTRDLRLHTRKILAATDRGETVVVTTRGRQRAVLRRWESGKSEAEARERNPAFGIWRDREEDIQAHVRKLREGRELT